FRASWNVRHGECGRCRGAGYRTGPGETYPERSSKRGRRDHQIHHQQGQTQTICQFVTPGYNKHVNFSISTPLANIDAIEPMLKKWWNGRPDATQDITALRTLLALFSSSS